MEKIIEKYFNKKGRNYLMKLKKEQPEIFLMVIKKIITLNIIIGSGDKVAYKKFIKSERANNHQLFLELKK